ncbi:CTP synthase C-terminal region-related (seleno)protein [Paenibacillus nasutitermitis]|uniref:CTP synthase (glutamine hydrolyzing) n=1 Tax=Paenibacillus nasutitermitis TaxID=1652958 RepID=A0A916YVQ5_9BACL|nr:CTP synthase [Paenibacillus nasutitermitis]GGD63176.1 hypothetical protein GCM10010911_21190 [Paenibacillus nasutitermitis]
MKIGIVGDYNPAYPSQKATQEALIHSASRLRTEVEMKWIASSGAADNCPLYNGLWIAPGIPESVEGILHAIQYARERQIPLLGTCGGFQYMVMEFAKNMLKLEDVGHEERNPSATNVLINKLECSLAGKSGTIKLHHDSKVHDIYQREETTEEFRCHYGLNAAYLPALKSAGLHISGRDEQGEPRVIEWPEHPFYIGTLYVPQLRSAPDFPHCLIDAFLVQAIRLRNAN